MVAYSKPPRALISVSDKHGVAKLAAVLITKGWQILSTGGTAKYLRDKGIAICEVAEVTGFPEIMDGRVKTLHPLIHGALLAKRDSPKHMEQAQEHDIGLIDLLVVNLYPFVETIAKKNVSLGEAIENIDIGGPAMIRAAAKNHDSVTVLVSPDDYAGFIDNIQKDIAPDINVRRELAAKAYAHTSRYDYAVQKYLYDTIAGSEKPSQTTLPIDFTPRWTQVQTMRYGENAHQQAALYSPTGSVAKGLAGASILQGKAMSYNNFADADTTLRCVTEFEMPACVIVKHANPCGVAVANTLLNAYQRAFSCDPNSAFGGIIGFNREVDAALATAISAQFAEVILAPSYSAEALALLAKKANLRLIQLPMENLPIDNLEVRTILGGLLVQTPDLLVANDIKVLSIKQPNNQDLADLQFAFTVAKHVKSNAIVFTRAGQTLGVGAGQMSRVMSTRIAVIKAHDQGFNLKGSVVASDAFFPFRDGLDELAKAGARAVIQPGGSIRDEEVINAADEHGMIMVTTGIRHFRH